MKITSHINAMVDNLALSKANYLQGLKLKEDYPDGAGVDDFITLARNTYCEALTLFTEVLMTEVSEADQNNVVTVAELFY